MSLAISILESVARGKQRLPPRIILYGTEGIGKSTFAANAPKPIFIQTEDGLSEIDCDKFPLSQRLDEVQQQLSAILSDDHEYETCVIDSLDWLERLIFDHLCREHGAKSIETVAGGFAKGYTLAVGIWRDLLDILDKLRTERRMAVVLIAHSKIERFEDPESPAYDRYAPRLHKHACSLVCEWADAVLFASRKIRVQTEDAGFNKKRGTAVGLGKNGGDRIIRAVGGPACVAKNRYGMPDEIDLSWAAFVAAMSSSQPVSA